MEIVMLAFCDEVVVNPDTARTDVLGIHNRIELPSFPFRLDMLRVAIWINHAVMAPTEWSLEYRLVDEDGKAVENRPGHTPPNAWVNWDIVGNPPELLIFRDVIFERPGEYAVIASLNGVDSSIPLFVRSSRSKSEQGGATAGLL